MKHLNKILLLFLGIMLLALPFGIVEAATADTALASIEFTEDTFEYTGKEIHPEFTVYDEYGNTVSADKYTCEYIHAVKAGNPYTRIAVDAKEGSGFKGGLEKNFTITPVSVKKVTVSGIADAVYTGAEIRPYPVITYKGKTLVKGTDYLLTYKNNVNAGTATVTVTGRATSSEDKTNKNFSGEIDVTFKIRPQSIENYKIQAIADRTYTGSAVTPGVVIMNGDTKLYASRYKLSYKNNVNAGTATVTAMGTGNYCGTVSATFKILPKQVTPSITLSKTAYEYDGTAKKPKVKSVTYGGNIPIDSSNYTVKYSSGRTNAGTYSVTVTLKGNFSGKNSRNFVITPRSIKEAKVSLEKRTYTYNGKAFKPKVTVTMNDTVLVNGTDYKVTYSSNKNVGTGKVQIEGIGNYKHYHKTQAFVIRKQVQKFTVTPKAESFALSLSKVKKADQQLTAAKLLKISGATGTVTYSLGYASGGKFTVDEKTGTVTVGKGTPKGTYSITLRLCAEGDATHVRCYRLVDIVIKVK